jgi:flavin reductase (DIM6/NTAB) family NADH-FMN oxidoreductase RutF
VFYRTDGPCPLRRNPLTALISPRPIAWISTRGPAGQTNLAPYSFFTMVAYTPPQVIVSSVGGKADRPMGKDSFSHARETGVFCINIAGFDDREAVNQSSAPYLAAQSELEALALEQAECRLIDCPRLARAPAALECRLVQHVTLEGEANHLLIARIEAVHLREDCLTEEGLFDVTRYRPLARLGYQDFASVDQVFALPRPGLPEG